MDKFVLGVDIGTSNVKISVVSIERKLIYSDTKSFKANIIYDSEKHEQNPIIIILAICECIENIPLKFSKDIIKIGISGQMHGCMLWNNAINNFESLNNIPTSYVSSLYTWEDKRTQSLVPTMPLPLSPNNVYAGYGCTTLYWLSQHINFKNAYDLCGTISDFFISYICKLSKSSISYHNATSWGYFDTITNKWNFEILEEMKFPISLLPNPVSPGTILGHLSIKLNKISFGIPVYVAMGDLQTSVYACLSDSHKAIVNMGTSSQVVCIMPSGFIPSYATKDINCKPTRKAIEYIPYFGTRFLASAPSLNGGNILAMFTHMIKNWLTFLGLKMSEEEIWFQIDQRMPQILSALDEDSNDNLEIKPTVFPERYAPNESAWVCHIAPEHLTFEKTFIAICKGIVKNLGVMMPRKFLQANQIDGIICMGMAIAKNPVLQREIGKQYDVTVYCPGNVIDASYGAALAIINDFKVDA